MKAFLRSLPVVLSALLLAAHFFRTRSLALVVLSLALPLLLILRRRWAARVVQAGLLLGAGEWVRTLTFFAGQRMEDGRPWVRLVLILGGVAVLTALSALAARPRPQGWPGTPETGSGLDA